MPLHDYLCASCGKQSEVLILGSSEEPSCPHCGGTKMKKLLSAHSSLSGTQKTRFPGAGDTSCCGSTPSEAGCAGPGSCCGKA